MDFDPDAEVVFKALREARLPRFETLTPGEARELLRAIRARNTAPPQSVETVTDLSFDGPAGPVVLRRYRPSAGPGLRPALVYCHGGGFVIGSLDSHDGLCRALAVASGIDIVSVDYRLAPEHPFPAGLDDVRAALNFVVREAGALGLDPARIGIGGDSAGANLAAVVALEARDGGLPPVRVQILACPVLDLTLSQPSQALDVEGLAVNGPTMRWFRRHYLGEHGDGADWRQSPLAAPSLAGAPSCHLITAGIDPLCDEGVAYAARLAREGVRFVHEHYPGQMHGFVSAGVALPTSRRAIASMAATMRAELA
jgi:acetyl esterase